MKATTRAARTGREGFTLVELLVSLTAGLLVALAMVGLSKEATSTFHEEARAAAAESQLRTAIDRLRADVARASFMSTGNIQADPTIARAPGASPLDGVPPGMLALRRLAGIRLEVGGSVAGAPLSASAQNGLTPDAFELAGNFTSTEQLVVASIGATGTSSCGGQRVTLDVASSPAMWRLLGLSDAGVTTGLDAAIAAAFQPVEKGQFFVRVADDTGHFQFVATCRDAVAAAYNGGAPYVDLDPGTPILTAAQLGTNGGVAGLGAGRVTVNPVQVVRWQIGASTVNPNGDAAKYDLTRQYVDATGTLVGAPELVAEYAVDLKLAFAVDPSTDATGGQAAQTVLAFDDAANGTWAADVSSPAGKPQNPGPQRIRSVRIRLALRTALADRSQPLDVGAHYTVRYCVAMGADGGSGTCAPGSTTWARARTVVTEVGLPNQARFFYP